MTRAQERVYKAVRLLIEKTGRSPSIAEISRVSGLRGFAIVHHHIEKLIEDGYLVKQRKVRGLVLAPDKVFYGFHRCDARHEMIYFRSAICPLCEVLNTTIPPRTVSSS